MISNTYATRGNESADSTFNSTWLFWREVFGGRIIGGNAASAQHKHHGTVRARWSSAVLSNIYHRPMRWQRAEEIGEGNVARHHYESDQYYRSGNRTLVCRLIGCNSYGYEYE